MKPAAIAVVLGLYLVPSPAAACGPTECVSATFPSPGQVDVPTNALVAVHTAAHLLDQPAAQLVTADGGVVPCAVTNLVGARVGEPVRGLTLLRPWDRLPPNTQFRIVTHATTCTSAAAAGGEFTTGPTTAGGAMAYYPGPERVDWQLVHSSTAGCPYVPPQLLFTVAGPTAPGAVAYRLRHNGSIVDVAPEPPLYFNLWDPRPGTTHDCFSITALDSTGDESGWFREVCTDVEVVADASAPDGLVAYPPGGEIPDAAFVGGTRPTVVGSADGGAPRPTAGCAAGGNGQPRELLPTWWVVAVAVVRRAWRRRGVASVAVASG